MLLCCHRESETNIMYLLGGKSDVNEEQIALSFEIYGLFSIVNIPIV